MENNSKFTNPKSINKSSHELTKDKLETVLSNNNPKDMYNTIAENRNSYRQELIEKLIKLKEELMQTDAVNKNKTK